MLFKRYKELKTQTEKYVFLALYRVYKRRGETPRNAAENVFFALSSVEWPKYNVKFLELLQDETYAAIVDFCSELKLPFAVDVLEQFVYAANDRRIDNDRGEVCFQRLYDYEMIDVWELWNSCELCNDKTGLLEATIRVKTSFVLSFNDFSDFKDYIVDNELFDDTLQTIYDLCDGNIKKFVDLVDNGKLDKLFENLMNTRYDVFTTDNNGIIIVD